MLSVLFCIVLCDFMLVVANLCYLVMFSILACFYVALFYIIFAILDKCGLPLDGNLRLMWKITEQLWSERCRARLEEHAPLQVVLA